MVSGLDWSGPGGSGAWCGYLHVSRRATRIHADMDEGLGLGGIVSSLCGTAEVSEQATHDIHIHTTQARYKYHHLHYYPNTSISIPQTVITDYPAPDILSNLQRNITSAVPSTITPPSRPMVQGHEWGVLDDEFSVKNKGRFTRVIAAGT